MYGTIMRGRLKAGKRDAYVAMIREREAHFAVRGLHSIEIGFEEKDPDAFVAVIHFKDRESYVANAEDPETDAEYRRQLEFLDGEPTWIDVDWDAYLGKPLGAEATAGSA